MKRENDSFLEFLDIHPERHRVISVVGGGGKTSLIFRLTEELVSLGKKVIVTTTTHMAYDPLRPFVENACQEDVRENIQKFGYTVAACMAERQEQEKSGSEREQEGKKPVQKIKGISEELLDRLKQECDVILIEADGAKRLPLKVPAEWEPVIPEITDLVIGVIGLDCLGKRIFDTAHRPEMVAKFLGKSPEDFVTLEDVVCIAGSDCGLCKKVGNRDYRVYLNKADTLTSHRIASEICGLLQKRRITAAWGSLKNSYGNAGKSLAVIILAAGNSRRFGSNKLLHSIEGIPMYQSTLEKVLNIRKKHENLISSICIVTQYPEIKKTAEQAGTDVIMNPHPEKGISSSIKLGLEASLKTDACLFMVADQPWLKADTIEKLIILFYESAKGMAAVANKGEPGNPCIFSSKYYTELMALTGDKGGKKVMKRHFEDVALLEISDKKELTDVDVPL